MENLELPERAGVRLLTKIHTPLTRAHAAEVLKKVGNGTLREFNPLQIKRLKHCHLRVRGHIIGHARKKYVDQSQSRMVIYIYKSPINCTRTRTVRAGVRGGWLCVQRTAIDGREFSRLVLYDRWDGGRWVHAGDRAVPSPSNQYRDRVCRDIEMTGVSHTILKCPEFGPDS